MEVPAAPAALQADGLRGGLLADVLPDGQAQGGLQGLQVRGRGRYAIFVIACPQPFFATFCRRYRKQTKFQFARDDPAFLVLLAGWLVVSTAGFALVLGVSFAAYVKLLLYVVFVDCIGVGMAVATVLWALCNRYLVKPAFR